MVSRDMLSKINLFEGIPEECIAAIAEISEEITYQQGATVFLEASRAEHMHILLDGEVNLQVSLTSRSDYVTVAVINVPYVSFGWSGVVPPYIYTSSAICEKDCRVLAIQGEKMIRVLKNEPEFGLIVMQRISELISRRLTSSRIALLKTL